MNEHPNALIMTKSQLQTELMRCEYCEEKPCKEACPVNCSPFDFIMAARLGNKSDIRRSAAEIIHANPLGGVCGMVCPDTFCMAACTRKNFDGAINIPKVQATLVELAKSNGGIPKFSTPQLNGKKVAVIGGGPAGLGTAAALAQMGYAVDIYESRDQLGGMMNMIPDHRLDKKVVKSDIEFLLSLGAIKVKTNTKVDDPKQLLQQGYHAVCVTVGLWKPIELGIENESGALKMVDLLSNPNAFQFNERVAIIGGGATAIDCAITAKQRGAKHVEMFMLEKLSEMPLTSKERQELIDFDIEVNGRIRVTRIKKNGKSVSGIDTLKVELPEGQSFSPANIRDLKGTEGTRDDFDAVVIAIGMRSTLPRDPMEGVFYAGDMMTGPKTVVQAVASGKNAALEIDASLKKQSKPAIEKTTKSHYVFPGYDPVPVSLATDFFGRPIRSPYLLSASPMTDGLDQVQKAYEAGWAGAIMKTAFDNVPIHIPAAYMFSFSQSTYANADNVSGHPLDRVCREIKQLVNNGLIA